MMEVREHRDDLLQRLPRLRLGFTVALVLIGASYWFVQVVQGAHFRELAENNRLNKLPIRAPRGLIYDRHEHLLVDNVPSYELLLDRSRSIDLEGSLDFAARQLGRPRAELEKIVERNRKASLFSPILLAESLSLSQVARFSAAQLEHPEFDIEVGHLRVYRHGPLTAHALGYLGEVTLEDLNRPGNLNKPGDLVGKRGVELTFDAVLRGADGERVVVVDSRGRPREEYGGRPADPGSDLHLTLDLDLQQEAASYFQDRVGAAVALDPRNGEVLVLVSAPSYDPNRFARRLDRSEWKQLVEDPRHPLQNRALQSTYSPGSTFKIVVAVAGLSDGLVRTSDRVFCGGSAKFYGRQRRCWKRVGHGWVGLREAIKMSCDVYFYNLGQKLGIARLAHYSRLFGFGDATGIDIGGERPGLVPDLEWSLRARRHPWYPGETISVAIGQGPLLVTPLQVASMMAIVASGGQRVVPHLNRAAAVPGAQALELSRPALETVREALWAVVNERGTGANALVPDFPVAGKTGTVQVIEQKTWIDGRDLPPDKRDHAWFASFASVDSPELVVVVFVEHGGKGSEAAAPLAKRLYEKYSRTHRGHHQSS